MRFELDDDATTLRDAVTDLLTAEVTPAVIRAAWPGGDRDLVAAAWRRLADLGAIGTLVAEPYGGLGLDENSLVPLLEEVGYSGLPGPVVETIAVAAPMLASSAVEAHRSLLADVLAGTSAITAVFDEGDLLPYSVPAAAALFRRGDDLTVVDLASLALTPVSSTDGSRWLARVESVGTGDILSDDAATINLAWQRGVLGTSAVLVGLARRMLDLTVNYVKQREQFGVPIGSFQAVKHSLATALVAVQFARPMVSAAGWSLAAGEPDAAMRVSAAKVQASDAARLTARIAIQGHGAMGYTTEYDLHLFTKRAWALAAAWGDPTWHRARLATALGV